MRTSWPRLAICALAAALGWAVPSRAGEPNWPDHLNIGTASPGGTYYVYGEGLARILTRSLGLPVLRLATEGPTENIELLEKSEAKLGFVTMGIALQAWNGTGAWARKKPARSMRAIFPMYDTPFQLLALQESGIRSVAEMSGKRVGVGPAGGTAAAYFPEFFRLMKIPVQVALGEWADLAAQLQRRELDVLAVAAGVPFPSFIEIEAKEKVRYIAFMPVAISTYEQYKKAPDVTRQRMYLETIERLFAGTLPFVARRYCALWGRGT
jgi:TRAP transporter TAXI family solute receptor